MSYLRPYEFGKLNLAGILQIPFASLPVRHDFLAVSKKRKSRSWRPSRPHMLPLGRSHSGSSWVCSPNMAALEVLGIPEIAAKVVSFVSVAFLLVPLAARRHGTVLEAYEYSLLPDLLSVSDDGVDDVPPCVFCRLHEYSAP